jgi:hypothetical protein
MDAPSVIAIMGVILFFGIAALTVGFIAVLFTEPPEWKLIKLMRKGINK